MSIIDFDLQRIARTKNQAWRPIHWASCINADAPDNRTGIELNGPQFIAADHKLVDVGLGDKAHH
jgi:hypothetical protein